MANVKMTRQHFELIAETIRDLPNPWIDVMTHRMIREEFADALSATNPNFDRERFIAAATREG